MTHETYIDKDIVNSVEGPFAEGRQMFVFKQTPKHEKSQYLRSMSMAIDMTLDNDPLYAKVMASAAEKHAKIGPRYYFDLSWRAIQANELRNNDTYPEGFEEVEMCIGAIKRALQPENIDTFIMSLNRGVPSNKARRGLVFEAVAALHGMEEISIWDFGSSTNQVLKIMALQGKKAYRYIPPAVVDISRPGKNAHPKLNAAATKGFAKLLKQNVHLKFGGGIDIHSPEDPLFMDHVRGSSFYPEELVDRTSDYDLYGKMEAENPAAVKFYEADFLLPLDISKIREKLPNAPKKVDMVMMSYSLYQLTPKQRKAALSNAQSLLKKNSKLVILEAGSITKNGAISSCDPRLTFRSGVWVYDMAKPDKGYMKYFTVDGGRIRQVHIEPAVKGLKVAKEFNLA
jgi:hypothetical protein